MKRFLLGAAAVLAAGCDNVEVALVIEEVPPPDDQCSFEVGDVEYPLTYDSQRMTQMFVPTEVTNILTQGQTTIVEADPDIEQTFPLSITPSRFSFRWECDSIGFAPGQGPLILPAFSTSPRQPFCLDTREETQDFSGFDVVPASGASVAPSDTAIWLFTPITVQLGEAFNVAFRLAELSEECCEEANGCENAATNASTGKCKELADLITAVSAGTLQLDNETINIWRPYYVYTARAAAELNRGKIANFPLRISGSYEGITASGDLITSTEFIRTIGVCKGAPAGTGDRCTLPLTEACMQVFAN